MATFMPSLPRLVACALLLAASAVTASPQALLGTWKGSIGGAPVMVCFDDFDAQYYYVRHRHGITLRRPDDGTSPSVEQMRAEPVAGLVLNEQAFGDVPDAVDGVVARWRLEPLQGDALSGTWAAVSGRRSLPIRLTRAALPGKDGVACGAAFMAPLVAHQRPQKSPGRFGTHAYQVVATADARALELGPEVPHAARFNRFATDWLQEQATFAYDCERGASRPGGALDRSLEPVFWSDRLLVLRDAMPEVYCGGAHGNASLSYVVWSIPQGQQVDPWVWVQGGQGAVGSLPAKDGPDMPRPLRRLIIAKHPRNDDCGEHMGFMGIDAPYPVAQGLVFNTSFAHAVRACNDEVQLSWKLLLPYLSRQGRELMQAGP